MLVPFTRSKSLAKSHIQRFPSSYPLTSTLSLDNLEVVAFVPGTRRPSQQAQCKRRCQCFASAAQATALTPPELPRTAEEQTALAKEALQRAEADGVKRQRMQLLLPIDARASNFLDTEPRDYPCSMKEEFEVAVKVASKILQVGGSEVRFRKIGERDQEMDPVGLVSTADKRLAAVVYPIAETLKQIQELAGNSPNATLALVNPQWNNSGQIVSDFGIGPWKRKAEEFLDTFRPTFELAEQRIGEASNIASTQGGVVRLLRAYPHDWQVFLMSYDGNNECVATYEERPSYAELERLLQEVRKTRPATLSALSTSAPPPPPLARSVAGPFTDDEIDGMDKSELRRALTALGLPTAGRLAVMQERVKDAQRKFGFVK
ncbi:hypothetical protein KFL_001640220 [Klebsormidium nitens]|uniref:SAP domain-containing protein n=1 Tax=Klebsormidium nitens TaxID=105231 RepID=A0A0U9HK80_KLENI|nr:hypothetical protein KFL_001640220 [Klebsormidium nitens]|eukprot:GAQ83847.1 hypothetical protein KFL_001640220 [Klebsormidium nitens]